MKKVERDLAAYESNEIVASLVGKSQKREFRNRKAESGGGVVGEIGHPNGKRTAEMGAPDGVIDDVDCRE